MPPNPPRNHDNEEQRSVSTNNASGDAPPPKKEIYTHSADWTIYGMGWSQREEEDRGFRLALGSFVEEYANRVSIIQRRDAYEKAVGTGVGRDRTAQALQRKAGKDPNDSSAFVQVAGFEHPYPATKILWSPDKTARRDLLATTGDYLRVWSVPDQREAASAADAARGPVDSVLL